MIVDEALGTNNYAYIRYVQINQRNHGTDYVSMTLTQYKHET